MTVLWYVSELYEIIIHIEWGGGIVTVLWYVSELYEIIIIIEWGDSDGIMVCQ